MSKIKGAELLKNAMQEFPEIAERILETLESAINKWMGEDGIPFIAEYKPGMMSFLDEECCEFLVDTKLNLVFARVYACHSLLLRDLFQFHMAKITKVYSEYYFSLGEHAIPDMYIDMNWGFYLSGSMGEIVVSPSHPETHILASKFRDVRPLPVKHTFSEAKELYLKLCEE